MTSQENLFDTFRAGEIDAAELSEIAGRYFPSIRGVMNQSEVHFGPLSDRETYALKFVYTKKRQLSQILAGPALTTEHISRIRATIDFELREPFTVRIGTQVLFSGLRVSGWFRYRDRFQIIPVPPGSPRGFGLGGEPFLIQFKYRCSPESMLNTLRHQTEVRETHLLLNALLEFGISRLQDYRHRWVLLPTVPDKPMATAYCQEMYAFSGPPFLSIEPSADLPGEIYDAFASVDGLDPLVRIEPQTYYTRRAAVGSLDRKLAAPSNLETLLDHFYSSSANEKEHFLRACFWYYHAQTVFAESSSAGFTALIRAIESLMRRPKAIGTCPICQRSIETPITRRMSEFLDEFAPDTSQESRAKLYYEFRSRLTHGDALTISDQYPFLGGGLTAVANQERRLSEEVRQLVRVVLVNWLHRRSPLPVDVHRGVREF